MNYKNYILISKHLFRSEYIYADAQEYMADQLFINQKIRVKFCKEYGHENEKYCMITCKIWNRDIDNFLQSMEKLRSKMALIGNTDYKKFCEETFSLFD